MEPGKEYSQHIDQYAQVLIDEVESGQLSLRFALLRMAGYASNETILDMRRMVLADQEKHRDYVASLP